MRAIAVIPARYASVRFPGKPLCPLLGEPMIGWVVRAAKKAKSIDEVCVATDHEGIARAAAEAGARVVMTSPDCPSGTDRVAQAAQSLEGDVIVNLQGDEPTLDPRDIDALVAVFAADNPPRMATLARPVEDGSQVWNPDLVKVVRSQAGDALYFSRSPLPYFRDEWKRGESDTAPPEGRAVLGHVGIYAFTREALFAFTQLDEGVLERAERLEQLRALEAGWRIRVADCVGAPSVGVDRPEDVERAEAEMRQRGFAP